MNRRSLVRGSTLAVILLLALPRLALATLIHFDDVSGGGFIGDPLGIHPGNQYAAQGVLFRTGDLSGTVSVGSTVTLNSPVDGFEVLNVPISAVSDPNLAVARGGGLNDLLMIFTTPVTSVSLTSDEFPGEPADVIRLIALEPTANLNEFTVLAFDEKLDNTVSSPANLLSVALGGTPFSYALFQVTTEQEGFDNLNFSPVRVVPEPPALALAGIGLVAIRLSRWRQTLNKEGGKTMLRGMKSKQLRSPLSSACLALAAVIVGWPGTADAFLFQVEAGTTDQFGVLRTEFIDSSSLPVAKSSSQSWSQTWGRAQSEAVAAAGNVVSQQLIPILSARSFAHWSQSEDNGEQAGETNAFAWARFVYGGFVIDGPPGLVSFSVNYEIEGGMGADHLGANMGVTSGVSFSGGIDTGVDESRFVLGDLSICERGASTLYPCREGGPHVFASGALFGVSVPGRFSVVAPSPTFIAEVGVPFEIEMQLMTSAFAFLGSSVQGSGGAPGNFATAVADFANTAGLWDGGPLFNLPPGYTAHSLDGLVVDNRLRLPGPPAPVPAPPTLGLLLLGAGAMALARRSRRGRRGVAALAVLANVLTASVGGADASPVTFGFSGRVTSANFGPDDQPYPNPITTLSGFSGRYTFDSSAADLDPASNVGRYVMAGSPFGLTVDIGGNTFTTANRLLIEVDNASSIASSDAYLLGAGDLALFRLLVGLFLLDPTGGALSSDALPLTPPPLTGFATRTFVFQNDVLDRGLVHITGRIDTLTCLAGCAGAGGGSPLPEPSTLLLVLTPLGFIGVTRFFATRLSARSLGYNVNPNIFRQWGCR